MMPRRSCPVYKKCCVTEQPRAWRRRRGRGENSLDGADISPMTTISIFVRRAAVCSAAVLLSVPFVGSGAQGNLTVERIFSGEFRGAGVGPSRWLDDSTYT